MPLSPLPLLIYYARNPSFGHRRPQRLSLPSSKPWWQHLCYACRILTWTLSLRQMRRMSELVQFLCKPTIPFLISIRNWAPDYGLHRPISKIYMPFPQLSRSGCSTFLVDSLSCRWITGVLRNFSNKLSIPWTSKFTVGSYWAIIFGLNINEGAPIKG